MGKSQELASIKHALQEGLENLVVRFSKECYKVLKEVKSTFKSRSMSCKVLLMMRRKGINNFRSLEALHYEDVRKARSFDCDIVIAISCRSESLKI